jgi:hypothetical protein
VRVAVDLISEEPSRQLLFCSALGARRLFALSPTPSARRRIASVGESRSLGSSTCRGGYTAASPLSAPLGTSACKAPSSLSASASAVAFPDTERAPAGGGRAIQPFGKRAADLCGEGRIERVAEAGLGLKVFQGCGGRVGLVHRLTSGLLIQVMTRRNWHFPALPVLEYPLSRYRPDVGPALRAKVDVRHRALASLNLAASAQCAGG